MASDIWLKTSQIERGSTHFIYIYSYMASDIWLKTSQIERGSTHFIYSCMASDLLSHMAKDLLGTER